jgi:hypothetical protein
MQLGWLSDSIFAAGQASGYGATGGCFIMCVVCS